MKKTIILLAAILITIGAACQNKAQTFNVLITFKQGIKFGDGTIQLTAGGGGSMVYPSTGIAVSTGTGWGTSVPNNSAFWNTAYSWGNHAGLYRPITYVPTWNEITGKPTVFPPSVHNHDALYRGISWVPTWNDVIGKPTFAAVATTGSFTDLVNVPEMMELEVALPSLPGVKLPVLTQTQINALTPVKGLLLFNDTEGVLQIYTGTVWKVLATTNQ